MIELSPPEHLLAHECAGSLPMGSHAPTPASLERLRFATIRVSGGSLDRLREAVRLAQIDWRDLIVAAGFGLDVDATSAGSRGDSMDRVEHARQIW